MGNNKTVVITGSSRGIGRELALHFARRGYNVVINYNKSQKSALELLEQLKAFPIKSVCIKADVGNPFEVKEFRRAVESEFGEIHVLINNAGLITRPGAWNEITDDDMLTTVKVNLLGPMYMIREFVPLLEKSDQGNIINLTSTYAYNGAAAVLAYTSSKAGIMSLTKAMALELAKMNIRVNAIAPGNFDTEMTSAGGEELKKWILSTTPIKRLGRPKEISDCVDFLLRADFVTGHILDIDGGQILNI